MTLSKEELSELVKAGAVTDIFKAERAYAVLKTIGRTPTRSIRPNRTSGNCSVYFKGKPRPRLC